MDRLLREKNLLRLLCLLLLTGLFLHLGVQPLFLEEPRRAFIALEMWRDGNWLAPTMYGDWYYKKPPFFNWLLLLSAQLPGGFSEFNLRLPTVLATVGLATLVYWQGRIHWDERLAAYAALLFVSNVAILFYFSMLAEIDLVYSLITFSSIVLLHHFGRQSQFWWLFLVVYFLTALGFLCKGLPSFVFTGLSLLTYFLLIAKRPWMLFSVQHFAGILLLLVLVGSYYYAYSQILWTESSERTVSSNSWLAFLQHLWQFPLEFLKDTLPGSLLVPALFGIAFRQKVKEHPLLQFAAYMLLVNLLIYWLSPGTRMRYVYMLFPFANYLFVAAWAATDRSHWTQRFFRVVGHILLWALPVGSLALLFIADFSFLPYLIPLSVTGTVVFSLLLIARRLKPEFTMLFLLLGFALARIIFDLTVLPQRALDSGAQRDKELAATIDRKVADRPLYLYTGQQQYEESEKVLAYTATFYLHRRRSNYLHHRASLKPGACYLMDKADLPTGAKVLHQFNYSGQERVLAYLP